MARYSAEQIYAFAREAGFSPDRAATMTAIAMAESGGNDGAHNPVGENSKGLWQINQAAHAKFANVNLFDPVQNARAAFQVSKGGDDISPWTTTHKGSAAKYLKYREQAQAAAEAYGDGPNRGMWTGVSGYGDHTPAGDARGGGQGVAPTQSPASTSGSDNVNVRQAATTTPAADPSAPAEQQDGIQYGTPLDDDTATGGAGTGANGVQSIADPTALAEKQAGIQYGVPLDEDKAPGQAQPAPAAPATSQGLGQQSLPSGDGSKLQTFLNSAVAQTGDKYVFGHEVKLNDPNPNTFDCSELVEWASHQAGVKMPDGAVYQYRHLAEGHHLMSVEQAMKTPGALLFSFSSDPMTGKPKAAHVAISLGNGKTIEAKGSQYGVGSWEANTKRFQYAGYIPEMGAGGGAVPPPPPPPPPVDTFSHRMNTDPAPMDRNPSTVAASHQLTHADPPPVPPPPPPPQPVDVPQPVAQPQADDLDHDNQDDGIQNAHTWIAPEDHSVPDHHTPDHLAHDGVGFDHDATPGH